MRILVVGAGAIGGYFGGRLLESGRDVTFLVRPRRSEQLARTGLSIRSPRGDADLPAPTVQAGALREPYDLILLSCKAYDLPEAMLSFAPAVGADTAILPLLNGMRHLDLLTERFGDHAVLGGQCLISATLDGDGRILHLSDAHSLSFGERDGAATGRSHAIASVLTGAGFDARRSDTILQDMWDKWVFIAAAAGITCLMRSSVGDIVAAGAADLASALLDECAAIAASQGFPPDATVLQRSRTLLTAAGSGLTASMLRDVEHNARTEVDHVLGDLLRRGEGPAGVPTLLRIAYAHLCAYEVRRGRPRAA
ncbi:MAG TPA: 2-dehydropantoate 2-reductase [Acetobacteraceae bacterium]|nr:2-dehydropantoate 2-reductase [Acetobacteraceae bacterium]